MTDAYDILVRNLNHFIDQRIQESLEQTRATFAKTNKKHHFDLLKQMLAEADLAFGVFNDAHDPRGVGMTIIKGEQALLAIQEEKTSANLKLIAIPCQEYEEAIAMKTVFCGLN
jgi:hypothetical protein